MSLNGLETPEVELAYQTVLQGRGGWFLLHYTSRDSIDVLAQGAKGLNEMKRAADACYAMSEPGKHSPMYGMIDFRRRKVLLKLVVEGTSRLIQARVQVHWTYVTARFANHETIFESTSTEQWNDSGLTAHIELHSGRIPSASGAKKPVLDGIEEAEETTTPERKREDAVPLINSSISDNNSLNVSAAFPQRTSSLISVETSNALQKSIAEEEEPIETPATPTVSTPKIEEPQVKPPLKFTSLFDDLPPLSPPYQTNAPEERIPPVTPPRATIPEVSVTMEAPTPPAKDTPPRNEVPETRYSIARDAISHPSSLGGDRRLSSQSARPGPGTEYDPYDPSFYDSLYKPKVKLGPRPSMSIEKRGSSKSPGAAVATLPPGLRASRQGMPGSRQSLSSRPQSAARPKSRDSAAYSFRNNFPPPPPIPESTSYMQRPTSSSNSVKSLPATLTKSPGMSREKQRLMKFQQMYKDKQNQGAKSKASVARKSVLDDVEQDSAGRESAGGVATQKAPVEGTPKLDTKSDDPSDPIDLSNKSDSAVCMDNDPVSHERNQTGQAKSDLKNLPAQDEETHVERALPSHHVSSGDSEDVDTRTGGLSASSPTSGPESSEHNSTRPTSVSDLEDHEKDSVSQPETNTIPEADTPSTIVGSPSRQVPIGDTVEVEKGDELPSQEDSVIDYTGPKNKAEEEASGPDTANPDSATAAAEPEKHQSLHETRNDGGITPTATSFPSNFLKVASDKDEPSLKERRRLGLDHISIPRSEGNSDNSYDEDLMDELQDAEVQEALSLFVSKSPITPYFPRRPSIPILVDHSTKPNSPPRNTPPRNTTPPEVYKPTTSRKSPSPLQANHSPEGMHRSPSATSLAPIVEPDELISVPKRMRIGGGVAAKIADLQRSFSRGSAGVVSPTSAPTASVGRKSSFMSNRSTSNTETPPRSASSQLQSFQIPGSSFVRSRAMSKGSFESHESATTPSRNMSSSSIGKLDGRRISAYNLPLVEPKTETISVKATIIRTDGPQRPELAVSSDSAPLQLHESPLVISRQRAQSTTPMDAQYQAAPLGHQRARSSISQLLPSMKSASTLTLPDPGSPGVRESSTFPRSSIEGGWRSLGRRRSKSPSARTPTSPGLPRSMSSESINSIVTNESVKKGSKSSRLMKRMSNSLSSIASATRLPLGPLSAHSVREEEQEPVEAPKPLGFDIGDLNVQFPDTLLWKRRWVEIDNHGYIILKPPAEARSNGGIVKKFHFNEFTAPFAPDLERQEMPNSVMMDFRDGRTLQCQTQSLGAQKTVLRSLTEAHRAWNS